MAGTCRKSSATGSMVRCSAILTHRRTTPRAPCSQSSAALVDIKAETPPKAPRACCADQVRIPGRWWSTQPVKRSAMRRISPRQDPERRHRRLGAMRVAPAVGPLAIKIIRMVGDTRHLAVSPSLTLFAAPEGQPYQCRDELGAQFDFAACAGDAIAQLEVHSTHLGMSEPSGSDDHVPENRSKKTNRNNAKDKAPRVATEGLVVVGGQPVGIAHAKVLGRPPASRPHQTLIKIFLNPSLSRRCSREAGRCRRPAIRRAALCCRRPSATLIDSFSVARSS